MAWEFIAAGMYLLALLTMFVMTLTRSQCPSNDEHEVKSPKSPETVVHKKAA